MADETTIATGIDLSVNVQNALKGIQAVDKATSSMINSFQKLSDQVDAVIQRIENLTAVAAKANQTVNHINNSTNNSTNYNHTVDTGGIPTVSTKSGTFAMPSGGRNPKFRQAEDEFLNLQKEEVETQKKITLLTKAKADTLNEELKYIKQNADTAAKNAQARVATAAFKNSKENKAYIQALADKHNNLSDFYKYKSAHPEMFAAGALLRSPRYQFGRAFEGIGAKVSTFGVGSDKLEGKAIGGVISAIGTLMKSPVAGGAAALMGFANGILEVGKAATQAFAEIESIRTQLGVVFSSQTQADSMFGELAQYVTKSPFGVQQTSELAVLLKQSGVYSSDLLDTLKMIGDTAGGNMEKMKRIANNYAQIVSIGKASMLDMRQFAYAGIPIFEAVSKELGVSQQELRNLISDGKVTSDIIKKVFKDLTGVNGIFENATEKGAKTLKARLQNLADAKQLAMAEIGESFINIGSITGGDSLANNLLQSLEKIYETIKDWRAEKNNTKQESFINAREESIAKLEALIEYERQYGEDSVETGNIIEGLEKLLEKEKDKRDPDKDRAIYNEGYKLKTDEWREFLKNVAGDSVVRSDVSTEYLQSQALGLGSPEIYLRNQIGTIEQQIRAHQDDTERRLNAQVYRELGILLGGSFVGDIRKMMLNRPGTEDWSIREGLQSMLEMYETQLENYKKSKDITSKESLAHRETELQTSQNFIADTLNSNADSTDSMYKILQELESIYQNSEEYKKEQEEAHKKELEEGQKFLKEFSSFVNDKGVLKFDKLSPEQIQELIAKKAIKEEKKLLVTEGNSEEDNTKSRDLILSQSEAWVRNLLEGLRVQDRNILADKIEMLYKTTQEADDNKDFFKKFASFFVVTKEELANYADSGLITDEFANKYIQGLEAATVQWSLPIKGLKAVLEDKKKGKELPEYTELWKRIAASVTGWDASHINGSGDQFIKDYSNQASRNVVAGGIQGLISAGVMSEDILSRMNYNTVRQYKSNPEFQKMTKIDLDKRPEIPEFELLKKGWEEAVGDGIATVFSSTYTNRDFGIEDGPEVALNVTPILPNGDILSPDELERYVEGIFWDGLDGSEIVLGKFEGADALEKALDHAENLHLDQDKVYNDLGPSENKQGVYQINWQKTESEMIIDALSMRDGVKKSAAALRGLSNSLTSQLSVYEKLSSDMAGVGEDWSTINTSLKEGFKNNPHLKPEDFLDNAFEAYGKKQGGYGLSYDNEMGLVIENAELGFKESVETLKEQLKKDPNSLKGDLKAVVESLKIDTLPKALDLLRKSTMALNDTIGIANTLANQANTWREQAAKSRGEAFGNSIGAMGALRAATSSTYEDTSHYLKQPYLYVDKALAQSSGAITKSMNEQLARMVFSDTQFADIKSRYGEAVAKSDLSEGDNIKELLTLGRDWIKDMSFDDFVDEMSKYGLTKEEVLKLIEPVNATSSRLIDVIENSAFVDKNNVPIIRNSSPVDTLSPEVEAMLSSFMTEFMGKMATTDFTTLTDKQKEQIRKDYGAKGDIDTNKISEAANKFQNAGDNYHAQVEAMMDMFSAFGITMTELIDSAKDAVKATEDKKYSDAAASVLRSNFYNPLEYVKDDVFLQKDNTISQQWLMRSLGYEGMSFSSMSENMTKQALENYSKGGTTYSSLIDKYKSRVGDAKFNSLSEKYNSLSAENINLEDGDPKKISNLERMKEILHEIGDEANESSLAFADMTKSTVELGKNLNSALQSFAANAIGSTMSTWGKSLAEGADAGKAMKENFRELSSGLMSTMGEMMTQAGLAMIIGSLGKGPKFYAGLALIAAGAGASFLGGMLGADDDSDETDSEYDKLLRIKDDLADLLKQAREDAIYYENTLRHKNAISGNDALTTKKVNDAIITPSGNIISTHPDDYLIATKTPQTLVGGGAPTINFSVVDKSTGIKVTQQKSTYDESTNSIDFEAVIESKVQEIIATSKGDDAFNARNARFRGKMVIA